MAVKRRTTKGAKKQVHPTFRSWLTPVLCLAATTLVARSAWLIHVAHFYVQYTQDDAQHFILYNTTTAPSIQHQQTFWKFDEAAPEIRRAVTHYLQSIPNDFRLPQEAWLLNWTEYSGNPQNVYPAKLHLFEMNPSVVILPKALQVELTGGQTARYLATYRVTHWNNCFSSDIILSLFANSFDTYFRKIPRKDTDFLGLALLGEDLHVLHDTVVTLQNPSLRKFRDYDDFRVFELHDHLYLSTRQNIFPLHLTFSNDPTAPEVATEHWVPLQPAFGNRSHSTDAAFAFQPWLRPFPSCPVNTNQCKNLLYFVDGSNRTAVVYYPSQNPNHVKHVHLDTICGQQPVTPYNGSVADITPEPSFHTLDESLFPVSNRTSKMFVADRGSACCVSIRHPLTQQPLFMAVVHPKTVYPGQRLPQGVLPNIYLSRFIAFEKLAPYRIVARTGMFCLGYPASPLEGQQHPLWNEKQVPLYFGSNRLACPRIHFATGITKKYGDDSKIIIAYGVSDCLSRVVEVDQVDVVNMLFDPSKMKQFNR